MNLKTYRYIYQTSKWFSFIFAWCCWGYIVYEIVSVIFSIMFNDEGLVNSTENKTSWICVARLFAILVCSFLPYAFIHGWFVQCIVWKFVDADSDKLVDQSSSYN